MAPGTLPSMVPFPETAWKEHLVPEEWEACLDAWLTLARAHLSLSSEDFIRFSAKDESLSFFLVSYAKESKPSYDESTSIIVSKSNHLRKQCYLLCFRLLEGDKPPPQLTQWTFLADVGRMYGKNYGSRLIAEVWKRHPALLEPSMASLKSFLIEQLEAGLKGDLGTAEAQLKRLNHLLHVSPDSAAFFLAGSDFMDSLTSSYKIMNPPLRKAILSTIYLCLIGLTEGSNPQFSTLTDQLYALRSAAEAHKAGPTNVNDSMVAELVTVTPILKQVQQRLDISQSAQSRAKTVLASLEGFRKPGGSGRPRRVIERRLKKGKFVAEDQGSGHEQVHVHRISLLSQVQDLFPDLGAGFIVKLLDEYNDDVEQTILHLLEDSLPAHLQNADRTASLEFPDHSPRHPATSSEPHLSTPQPSFRRNVFDDDEFDQLAVDSSRLHLGRRNPDLTADDVLGDKSNAPNKAAILSALAAFDSDDDERDDTYDVEDVGGTVDSATPGNIPEESSSDAKDTLDEALFKAYKVTPTVFNRDAATRRGPQRISLKEQTGMTDEAIEGWGLMLSRDPRQMRRLDARFSIFKGGQDELAPTAWRASPAGSGTEDSDMGGSNRGRGGFRGRSGAGGGRGRGRGNVAGPTGDKDTEAARHRKEASKGSRANHNRRDQRARKMARGGFPG